MSKVHLPLGGVKDNAVLNLGNESYEWDFSLDYVPCKESLAFWEWERNFFTNEYPTPAFHYMLTDNFFRAGFSTKTFECYRGAAKSTLVGTKLSLYLAFLGHYPLSDGTKKPIRHIVLATASIGLAKGHMERVAETIRLSGKLSKLFTIKRARLDDYPRLDIINNLTGKMTVYEGKSPAQKSRGSSVSDGSRGDVLLLDDLESEESVNTPESRAKMSKWLTSVLGNSLAKGYLTLMIGTPLHEDSILSANIASKNVSSVKVKACKSFNPNIKTEDKDCAWSDMYNHEVILEDYNRALRNKDEGGFWREIMLEMTAQGTTLFDLDKIQWYDLVDEPKDIQKFISIDSGTGKINGDDTVFTVVGINPVGQWYVIDIIIGKYSIIEFVAKTRELVDRHKCGIVMEEGVIFNMLEPFLDDDMLQHNDSYEIITVKRNTAFATGGYGRGKGKGKLNVFKMFSVRVNSGHLFLPSNKEIAENIGLLLSQMRGVTHEAITTKKDDIIDTLAQMELEPDLSYSEVSFKDYEGPTQRNKYVESMPDYTVNSYDDTY